MDRIKALLTDKNFLNIHDNFKNCTYKLIKNGHNRSAFLVNTNDNKSYVAKIGSVLKDLGSSTLNDVQVQTFLTKMGCNFVPEIIYWSKETDFYIENYVGDKDALFDNLSDIEMDNFAKLLSNIHNFTAQQYQQFSQENGFDIPKIESSINHLKVFGFDRFKIAKKTCPDNYVIDWINKKLNKHMKILEKRTFNLNEAHLQWGDIGENLRKDKAGLYFIDWEFARLGFGSELAYIKIHSHLSPQKFDYLVSCYAFYSNRSTSDLLAEIEFSEKITRTNDVIWAAMKWGQAISKDDKEKYKDLTYKRIKMSDDISV